MVIWNINTYQSLPTMSLAAFWCFLHYGRRAAVHTVDIKQVNSVNAFISFQLSSFMALKFHFETFEQRYTEHESHAAAASTDQTGC